MKDSLFAIALAIVLTGSFGFAKSPLSIEGTIRIDSTWAEDADGDFVDDLRLKGTELKFTTQISDKIKLVVRNVFDRQLRKAGEDVSSSFDIEKFFKEAYIKITDVGGKPVAVVIGKREIAFGQDFERLLNYHGNPVHSVAELNQVIGITVALTTKDLGKIEASVFEDSDGAKDLDVGEVNSYSVRWSKELSENMTAKISYMHLEHEDGDDSEERVSLGGVYKVDDYTFWAEGVYFTNSSKYAGSDYAVNAGASKKMGSCEVVASISFVDNNLLQLATGVRVQLTERITLGPEARYNIYDDATGKDDGLTAGARVEVKYGAPKKFNKNPLLGKKKKK
jgi:hypothetical protein